METGAAQPTKGAAGDGRAVSSSKASAAIICGGWVVRNSVSSWSSSAARMMRDIVVVPPGPTQVRVKIYAAGVNPLDARRATFGQPSGGLKSLLFGGGGSYQTNGTAGTRYAEPLFPFPYVMGIEGAGVVESVGWEVANDGEQPYGGLRVGDRVAFISNSVQQTGGTFCQYALLHADAVCKIPPASQDDYIDFVEAASIPFAAGAAYVALFDKLRVQPGRSIFISGASGGVGTVAVQMAKYAGLSVLASCSTHNMGYVQQLGADFVFDYTSTDPTEQCLEHTQGVGVDYVLELADAALAAQHGGALRFGGHMCVLSGPMPNETMNHNIFFNRQISLSYVSLTGLYSSDATRGVLRSVIQTALQLYQAGAFRLFLETAPLERATEALDIVATSHTRGKIVLTNFHPSEESADDKVVGTRRRTGAGASNETTNQRTCATGRHE